MSGYPGPGRISESLQTFIIINIFIGRPRVGILRLPSAPRTPSKSTRLAQQNKKRRELPPKVQKNAISRARDSEAVQQVVLVRTRVPGYPGTNGCDGHSIAVIIAQAMTV
eukprot:3756476-Rhodomonas_salina.1